jgi:phosphotransacetylase
MSMIEELQAKLEGQAMPVVFPEADEPRVAEAITWLTTRKIVTPVPLAESASDAHVAALAQSRGMAEKMALRLLKKPLFRAAAMVATGEAATMVASADTATKRVIEAAAMAIGADAYTGGTVSSFFLMLFPDGRELIFADCAVNVAPTAQQLADIARASSASGEALLGAARPALLSYSTGTSGTGPSVELVRTAAELSRLPGPLQGDAALNAGVAAKKGLGAGDACQCRSKIPQKCRSNFPHFRDLVTSQIRGLS